MGGYIFNGKKIKKVGVLSEPNSYQATLTPENMQCGMTAVVKGKVIEGTGKCFEKASYGERTTSLISDVDGNEKYGISIHTTVRPNVIFIIPTTTGDIILQTNHIFELADNKATEIAINNTTLGKINVFYNDNRLNICFENIANTETKIKYFYGKDAQL